MKLKTLKGIGIVDLGLVYGADRSENGIEAGFTVTPPSCPFDEMLFEEANNVLHRRFGGAASKFICKSVFSLARVRGIWEN